MSDNSLEVVSKHAKMVDKKGLSYEVGKAPLIKISFERRTKFANKAKMVARNSTSP